MAEKLLIDKAVLGSFIDPLLISKSSGASVSERFKLMTMRRQLIKKLDDEIGIAIFSSFTREQKDEFDKLLDKGDAATEADFDEFFKKHGIDEGKIMTEVMEQFAKDFLTKEI